MENNLNYENQLELINKLIKLIWNTDNNRNNQGNI